VLIALSAPLVQALLAPWFKTTFPFPLDRFVSLWVFWIAVLLALGIAHFAEGYPLATFGFQRTQKTLRTRLIEWVLTALATLVIGSIIIFFSTFVRNFLTHTPAPSLDAVRLYPHGCYSGLGYWLLYRRSSSKLPIERLTQLTGRRWSQSDYHSGISVLTLGLIHVSPLSPAGVMLTYSIYGDAPQGLNDDSRHRECAIGSAPAVSP
jgi:hypothetical protein